MLAVLVGGLDCCFSIRGEYRGTIAHALFGIDFGCVLCQLFCLVLRNARRCCVGEMIQMVIMSVSEVVSCSVRFIFLAVGTCFRPVNF